MIFDPRHSEAVYMLMSLDEYEKLLIGKSEVRNLTEDELLDKINRDIAIWKSEQDLNNKDRETPASDRYYPLEPNLKNYQPRSFFQTEEPENKTKISKNHWRIPKERKLAAEEIIEEDRQYLEDI